nr:hypothetical protein [uncultured Sphaerochaeta sp.]
MKRSNKMLIGAGIFLAVYLLSSVLFGSIMVRKYANTSNFVNHYSYSVSTY